MNLKERSLKQFAPIRFRLFCVFASAPIAVGILVAVFYAAAPLQFGLFVSSLNVFGRLYAVVFHHYAIDANVDMPPAARTNVDGAILLMNLVFLLIQIICISSALIGYRFILPKWYRQRFRLSAGAYFAPMRTTATVMAVISVLGISDLFLGGLLIHYLEFQFRESVTSFGAFLYRATLLFAVLEICAACSIVAFGASLIDP